jgi:hypothetical protein
MIARRNGNLTADVLIDSPRTFLRKPKNSKRSAATPAPNLQNNDKKLADAVQVGKKDLSSFQAN